MTKPKLLLVSPGFHGYWMTIRDSIVRLGYEVVTHVYDAPGNIQERITNKILHDLPERFRPENLEHQVTEKAIAVFSEQKPDIVLVVKGDQLGHRWWETLERSGVRYGTWMYDELRRMRYTDELLYHIGPIASYSPADVQDLKSRGFDAIDVPLAYDSHMKIAPSKETHISFVGARYEGRERMLKALHQAGIPVRAYGKQWSRHWWDVARTRQFKDPGLPTGRDLDRSQAYGVMAASPGTLNIHGDQDGFTMRTFEASGVGGLQIIDRDDVTRYYEPGTEVLTYSSTAELIELCRRIVADPQWAQKIREAGKRRTLAEHTFDERVKVLETLWL
ncbi:CgeB family protein [Rothia sp. P7181]|uniref:CgeB family protein n=1 Tax=Rothia sp. P7181 TaxID=3402663 RepID=UPI003AEA74D4